MAVLCGMPTIQYSARSARLSVRLSKWAWPKITSGQSNLSWHTASPPQTDGSVIFARWRQCASDMGTLVPLGEYDWTCASSAHPSPQPKRQIDRFSRFFTAHGRKSLYFTMATLSPELPFLWAIWTPSHSWFLGPFRDHNPNGITIGSAVFTQMTTECPYTLQWAAPSPSKLPLRMGDLDLNLIHGSLGQPECSTQTASRSVCRFCRAQ